MKKLIALVLLAASLALAGCQSAPTRLKKFLSEVPATNLAEFKHKTTSPVFGNEQVVRNVTTRDDGLLNVGSASSSISFPLVGVTDEVTLSGFVQIPSPAQVSAGAVVNARPQPR